MKQYRACLDKSVSVVRASAIETGSKGTYVPTKSDPFGAANTATLLMPTGVALFGGFAGSEHSLAARNITNNVTAITGEIATSSINDNLMRIVTCADVLDLDLDGDNDTSEALSLDIDGATRVRGSSVDMGGHEAP